MFKIRLITSITIGYFVFQAPVSAFQWPAFARSNNLVAFSSPPLAQNKKLISLCHKTLLPITCREARACKQQRLFFGRSQKQVLSTTCRKAASSDDDDVFVEAEDLEALQSLFRKYCDSEGLMTKQKVREIPAISQLFDDGDLVQLEFDELWEKAPKFPDPIPESSNAAERIDVDSFVQIYRDIDDLFEDEAAEENVVVSSTPASKTLSAKGNNPASTAVATFENDTADSDEDDEEDTMEAELESIFESLCNKDKLVTKDALATWDEVSTLLTDGLLGMEEFEELWEKTLKSPGSPDMIDVDGFLSFSVALDGLFDFDDEDMMDEDDEDAAGVFEGDNGESEVADKSKTFVDNIMVEGDELSPEALFDALAGLAGKIDKESLMRWVELDEMIREGDLLASELTALFEKAAGGGATLDKKSFLTLYKMIDGLFEDDEAVDDDVNDNEPSASLAEALKVELLDALADLEDPDLLPCGLDATEKEQREILQIVTELEQQPSNIVIERQGAIDMQDLTGTWDLVYSSSSAMKFNKGLSGLGGSFPNGRFASLKQNLKATKFLSDVEYTERIEVTPSTASFDVTVTGDWELRTSVSLFTGLPSIVMTIAPGRVKYGLTDMKADHWKSLGPLNMLDISYLDEDLRIMRGNTAVETIFIYRRSSQ